MHLLTFRTSERASNRRPRIPILPNVLAMIVAEGSFLALPSPSLPLSTTKNGPIAIYTAWITIESDIATVSAQIILLMRGRTADSAWNISPIRCLYCTVLKFTFPFGKRLVIHMSRGEYSRASDGGVSTNGYMIFVS